MLRRCLLAIAMIAATAGTSGCGIQPWVKSYERANLADPIMSFDRDPVSGAYRQHFQEAREGARGAGGGHGGGCGCN